MELELRDYIIVIMIIITIYLLYNKYNKEHFTETSQSPEDLLKKQINDTFKVDLTPMRKLGDILKNLTSPTSTTNPSPTSTSTPSPTSLTPNIDLSTRFNIKKLILNNLTANEKYITNDIICDNNVIINHDTFNTYDIDIFPRGMIIAYYDKIIPRGWVLCDGQTYYVNKSDNDDYTQTKPELALIANYAELKTPNLIDRFILGANDKSGATGGATDVSLKFNQMPSHTHTGTKLIEYKMILRECWGCDKTTIERNKYPIDEDVYTYNYISMDPDNEKNEAIMFALNRNLRRDDYKIQATSHTNMPPYKKLFYIIKL
jgi:microcystin-dependent protein